MHDREDSVEIPADDENGNESSDCSNEVSIVDDSSTASFLFDSDAEEVFELEELVVEAGTDGESLRPGIIHLMGNEHYEIEAFLPRGYVQARRESDSLRVVLLSRTLAEDDFWRQAPRHPRLPIILYAGEDGLVLEEIDGESVSVPISLQEAVTLLHGVVQLMRFLAIKDWATTYIDLAGFRRTEKHEVRLQYLPSLVPMGNPAQVLFGDGATPIHGSETNSASEATSVFLWGALLHKLVSGNEIPAEGLDFLFLSHLGQPGLPQMLNASMCCKEEERDLKTLTAIYEIFQKSPAPKFRIGAATTIGLNPTRMCNEDSYGVIQQAWEYHDCHRHFIRACVADGMGGEESGELASQAAAHMFCNYPTPPRLEDAEIQVEWTRELGWMANRAVFETVGERGGGCTLTGIVLVDERLTLAHVGDSRAYLYSLPHGLKALSRDHSLVRALIDGGTLTEDEAAASSDTNQVLRALGTGNPESIHEEYIDILSSLTDSRGSQIRESHIFLSTGDLVLLMSDGIWGSWEYRESTISRELTRIIEEACFEPQDIADELLKAALDSGADDNATIVVVARVR